MSDSQKYDKIVNETLDKLKSTFVDILVNNKDFRKSKQIDYVLKQCDSFGIDPKDITDEIDPTEIISDVGEFRDASSQPSNFVKLSSKIANKIIKIIHLPTHTFTKNNIIRFQGGQIEVTEISPNSITVKPYVTFTLVTNETIEKEILRIEFEISVVTDIPDFEIIHKDKKILQGNLHVEVSVMLTELKTPMFSSTANVNLGSKEFDVDLFKYSLPIHS